MRVCVVPGCKNVRRLTRALCLNHSESVAEQWKREQQESQDAEWVDAALYMLTDE